MFGTIFRMRPKQGQQPVVEQLFQRWERERRAKAAGFILRHHLGRSRFARFVNTGSGRNEGMINCK